MHALYRMTDNTRYIEDITRWREDTNFNYVRVQWQESISRVTAGKTEILQRELKIHTFNVYNVLFII